MEKGTVAAGPETSLALANWASSALAMLIADLRSRRLVDEDFVTHLSDQLQDLGRDAPGNEEEIFDNVDYILGGDWITKRNNSHK